MVLIYTDRLETGINLLQQLKLLCFTKTAQSTFNPLRFAKTASTVHIQPTLFYHDSQHSPHSTDSVLQRQPAQFTFKLFCSTKTAPSALKILCCTKTASTVHKLLYSTKTASTVHTQTTIFYPDSQHSSQSNYSILPRHLARG